MNILECFKEKENIDFKSMATIEELPYIKHEVKGEPISLLNSLTREEKMTDENLEVPTCRTTRH